MNIGYIRVSTDKQENSVETQKDMLSSYSKIHDIEIDDYFIDFGLSGKEITKRKKYNELMDLVNGDKITTIITTSLSRWSRNTLDLLNSIDVLKKNDTDLEEKTDHIDKPNRYKYDRIKWVKNNHSSDDEPYQIGLENLRVMVYQLGLFKKHITE